MKKLAIILFTAMFLFGCGTKIPPRLNIHIETSATKFEAEAIVDSLYLGFDNLLNCEHLQTHYPEAFRKLILLQKDIRVRHIQRIMPVKVCGQAILNDNVIYLDPDVYYNDGCKVYETIPHEILHLIGISHDESEEACEEFYEIFWRCQF